MSQLARHQRFLQAVQRWAAVNDRDLGGRRWAVAIWTVAGTLLFLGFFLNEQWRGWMWAPAMLTAGSLCVVNAIRSRRFHCVLTGPILLVGGALTLLRSLKVISLGWSAIGLGVMLATGAALLLEQAIWKRRGRRCC